MEKPKPAIPLEIVICAVYGVFVGLLDVHVIEYALVLPCEEVVVEKVAERLLKIIREQFNRLSRSSIRTSLNTILPQKQSYLTIFLKLAFRASKLPTAASIFFKSW